MMETVHSLASSLYSGLTHPQSFPNSCQSAPFNNKDSLLDHYSEPSGDFPTDPRQNSKSGPRLQDPLGLGAYLFLDNTS